MTTTTIHKVKILRGAECAAAVPEFVARWAAISAGSVYNKGKKIWVERHDGGCWMLHADTPDAAALRIDAALAEGRPVFVSAFTTA